MTGSGRLTDRRALLRAAAGLTVAAAAVAGCGFQLRSPPELQLKRIQLKGFDRYSPLADELRRQLRLSPGVTLVEATSQPDAVLEAVVDLSDQVAAASTAAGQVRELTLRARFVFRVRNPAGDELIRLTELAQSRELSYAETNALAKENEAQFLVRGMHADIAAQVLRRLAALGPTAPVSALSSAPAPAASAASAVGR
jgi:LPS-assembly lipoprotein